MQLCKQGEKKTFSVHRLVALMFIPNPENKPEVNHKWGIKSDNRASELEWNTVSENNEHAYKTGLRKAKKGKESCRSVVVNQYDLQGNFIKEWNSMHEIQRELNIDYSCISKCCRDVQKSAGGYVWKYKI